MTTSKQVKLYRRYAAEEIKNNREPLLFSEWREQNNITTTEEDV